MVDALSFAAVSVVVGLLRRLPLGVCFLLGRWVGLGLWAVLPGYRRLARENMAAALGDELGERRVRALVREHFATMGANAASAFKVAAMSPDAISQVASIDGLERIRDAIARGQGVVLAINHIGNWELYAQLVYRVPEARFGTVYQALRNKRLDDLINADRRRLGVQTFDRRKGFAGAIGLLREPGIVGVLVDQNAGDGGMWTPFFNKLSSTSTLAAGLAARTGAAVVPVAITTDGFARWRVTLDDEISWQPGGLEQLTADINAALERQIRRSPRDWFWVHNRWKVPWPNFLITRQKRGCYLPPGLRPETLRPFRIVVRSPNWLGDACMAIEAARAFKLGRPDAHLAILAPAKLAPLWRLVPEVDEVIEGGGLLATARRLRGCFEVAVLFPNSLRAALEACGIARRVGRPGHWRRWLLNQQIVEKRREKAPRIHHHADAYMAIAERCGGARPPALPASWSPPTGQPVVAVCPGAEYGPAKRWPPERFRATIEAVNAATPCRWLIVGTMADRPVAGEIARGIEGVENIAGNTTIPELIATLRSCSALLTNDTGAMHLADFLGVPLVAIFGSTEPKATGPRHHAARVLRHHVECSPCFLRKCPIDFRCMLGVTPEAAAAALLETLARQPHGTERSSQTEARELFKPL